LPIVNARARLNAMSVPADALEETSRNDMRTTGLLRKAQALRDPTAPHLRILGPDELRVEQDDEITPEERQKVASQIEKIVADTRLKVTPDTFSFTARKNGGILPIIVNIAALIVVAAGVALAVMLSRQTERAIVAPSVTILTAEGKLVEALKEESRQKLEGKDKEISSIREKLAGIDQERARIRQEADDSVRQKEQELQDAFARSLQEERRRMEASGLSAAAVDARIAALEARSRAEREAQLASFRSQADADRAAREKTIENLQAGYQQALAQAQAERGRVQAEAGRKQAELEAGYKQKQLALERDSAAAVAELSALRQQRNNEQLILDQLLSWYQKVREQIQASRPDAARAVLADFRRFLDDPSLAALPAVARRRPIDLFLVDSLDQVVSAQSKASDAAETQSLVASAGLITAVATLVQQGDALFKDQGYTRARELYLSALARIPAVQAGYEKLGEIEKIYADRQKKEIAGQLGAANAAYKAGDFTAAADRYARALESLQGDREAANQLVTQLMDIGALRQAAADATRLKAAEGDAAARARRIAAIEALGAKLEAARAAAGPAGDSRNAIVALLETKLLVQQTLLRPDIAKEHPGLYDKLNSYFDALAAESRADARLETLRDLDALLGNVDGTSAGLPGAAASAPALASRYPSADEQGMFLSVIARLRALLK
jgi:hypothetical protein